MGADGVVLDDVLNRTTHTVGVAFRRLQLLQGLEDSLHHVVWVVAANDLGENVVVARSVQDGANGGTVVSIEIPLRYVVAATGVK
jgi:hypothetical protein